MLSAADIHTAGHGQREYWGRFYYGIGGGLCGDTTMRDKSAYNISGADNSTAAQRSANNMRRTMRNSRRATTERCGSSLGDSITSAERSVSVLLQELRGFRRDTMRDGSLQGVILVSLRLAAREVLRKLFANFASSFKSFGVTIDRGTRFE